MQVCPYIVSSQQGKPCLLFRACRYLSGLNRRGLCGLWRCCLHLTQRRYCRFFRLKALRDMHGGSHDPEVLKELRTAPDLTLRAMKIMAWSLGRVMSTLVVQENHLLLYLVDIGMPTKFVSSRFLYPRLASTVTQPVTWPSSSWLHGESWTDQLRTPIILPLASRQQWAVREHHQRLLMHPLQNYGSR